MSCLAKKRLLLSIALIFLVVRTIDAGTTGLTWKGQLWNVAVFCVLFWSADFYYKADKKEKRRHDDQTS